jgi:hypothetical protein
MWIEQLKDLLPVGDYYHVVFTVPASLNGLFLSFRDDMQHILFRTAWQTIEQFADDGHHLGAQTGMLAVLHTWGQTLSLHPHLHCIVPDGGINYRNEWVQGRHVHGQVPFLFPVRQLGVVFRGKFLSAMSAFLNDQGAQSPSVTEKVFNVYAKPPFRGLAGVVEYLGRYTHKTAIGNHRIESVDEQTVSFSWRDYKDHGREKRMVLSGEEFLRRFVQHIQNRCFRRLRYYGIFSPSNRRLLNGIRQIKGQLPVEKVSRRLLREAVQQRLGYSPCRCPACGEDTMVVIEILLPCRGPPCPVIGLSAAF